MPESVALITPSVTQPPLTIRSTQIPPTSVSGEHPVQALPSFTVLALTCPSPESDTP